MIAGLLAYILGSVQLVLAALWTRLAALDQMIRGRFGILGEYIFWGLIAGLVLLLLAKATKATFNILRFVLFPAAILTVVLLMLVPCWAPTKTFPILGAACSLVMLFRRA